MPPKTEVTRDKIGDAVFELVREHGFEALTARKIAQRLNCSTQPIYSVYGNMEQLELDAYDRALNFMRDYMRSFSNPAYSPALNLAIGLLQFARNEKHLFRAVYLSGIRTYEPHKDRFIGEEITMASLRSSKRLNAISEEKLKTIFYKLTIYLIGLGTVMNTGTIDMSLEEATELVRDQYEALLLKEKLSRPEGSDSI